MSDAGKEEINSGIAKLVKLVHQNFGIKPFFSRSEDHAELYRQGLLDGELPQQPNDPVRYWLSEKARVHFEGSEPFVRPTWHQYGKVNFGRCYEKFIDTYRDKEISSREFRDFVRSQPGVPENYEPHQIKVRLVRSRVLQDLSGDGRLHVYRITQVASDDCPAKQTQTDGLPALLE